MIWIIKKRFLVYVKYLFNELSNIIQVEFFIFKKYKMVNLVPIILLNKLEKNAQYKRKKRHDVSYNDNTIIWHSKKLYSWKNYKEFLKST